MSQPEPIRNAELDHYLPLRPVIAAIAACGALLSLLVELTPLPLLLSVFGMLLVSLSGVAWFLAGRWDRVSRWFTVTATMLAVLALAKWLEAPIALTLLSIPLGLAVTLISAEASAGLTLLLVFAALLPENAYPVPDSAELALSILSIGASLGLVYFVCRRVRQIQTWLQEYFDSHHRLLEEARDRKVVLEQSQSDWIYASRQLALANERLADLRQIAEEARKDKVDFVAKVSHEFRTPLNIIIGMISLMVEAPEVYGSEFPPKAMEQLSIVYRNCQHLASMIDDVLDLSQADAGKMALRRTQIDIRQIIDTALAVVRPLAQQKGLALDFAIPSDVPPVYCDGVRIRQVILNLLSNAARYTEKGSVAVSLQVAGGNVRIGVTDTGPGIPDEDKERIFEPFGRGGQALLRDQSGSGLGLTISKELVTLHGGRMWLETRLGVGSTFFFELPISAPAPLVEPPGSQIREDWVWRQRASWADLSQVVSKRRIIVPGASRSLRTALQHYEDRAELVYVSDLHEAAQKLHDSPAHALLVSSESPGTLWPKLSEARQWAPGTPVIGCCWPTQPEGAANLGAARYLTKPVLREDLTAALKSVNRRIARVLVTDDDADTREWLKTLLAANDPRIEVITADCGAKALEMMHQQPDLVLLDVVMPDMTGWEVLARIAADAAISETPVIMVSAHDLLDAPQRSEVLMTTMQGGLPIGKLLSSSVLLASLMLGPD